MSSLKSLSLALSATLFLSASPLLAATPYPMAWGVQAGTPQGDYLHNIALDDNALYVAADTMGNFAAPSAGGRDAVLLKYTTAGSLLWSWQFGTAGEDYAYTVDSDAVGNVYLTGNSTAALGGPTANGSFIYKLNSAGSLIWQTQLLPDGALINYIFGGATDPVGNSYFTGRGSQAIFLVKYDSSGNQVWRKNFASGNATGSDLTRDTVGNLYVSGYVPDGSNYDSILAKYDSNGNQVWLKNLVNVGKDTFGRQNAVDSAGNIYLTGDTTGNLDGPNHGDHDAFLAKYNAAGNLLWVKQFGTVGTDWAEGVSLDASGHVFVTGSLNLATFLKSFDTDGNQLWSTTLPSHNSDWGQDLATDAAGNVFLGVVKAPNNFPSDFSDYYLAEFNTNIVPEPASLSLLALAAIPLFARRRNRPM